MNKLILLALLTFSSAYANSSTIITSLQRAGSVTPEINIGFSDSSFDYSETVKPENKSMCFLGSIDDVCGMISEEAGRMNKAYLDGAHDSMQVVICKIDGASVKTSYELQDDYDGNLIVNRTIEACFDGSF